jgi:agmatinase
MAAASRAAVTLLGVRYDGSSSFEPGAADGPVEIRRALTRASSNPWTEGGLDLTAPGVLDDAGDITPGAGEGGRTAIEQAMQQIFEAGGRPLVLGGDHSITYPLVRAARARYPSLSVLHIDAHGDLYDQIDGDRFSHGCPMARIMEDRLADRLVQLGIRTLNDHQREQARRFGVEITEMRDWTEPIAIRFDGPVYLTLDVDAVDPAFAPGVAHPEPGGFSVRELLRQLRLVEGTVIGADLVELNPRNDPSPRTALVCAKLVKALVDLMAP